MDPKIIELEQRLSQVMIRDRFRLRKRLQTLNRHGKSVGKTKETNGNVAANEAVAEIVRQIEHSIALRQSRIVRVPKTTLDNELPIFARQDEIKEALLKSQVVVISGATGSGKSTQLPLIALQAGIGAGGMIGHTQPRRIAARSVANRIAQQIGKPLGTDVGFKIRFADQTNQETYIKVMTDGILLAETQRDRFLENYELIIIDEAHERSLNIDFLLGYLKRILPKRPDLKLVITSATIDTERFVEHFATEDSTVPIINVEGRTYPVDILYRPAHESAESSGSSLEEDSEPIDIEDHLLQTLRDLAAKDNGDMLVFLPTENDIRSAHKKLRSAPLPGIKTEILPLYARLTNAQQNEIFSAGASRRIVLATNVAESSITVPRIRFVVDTGTARISHYAPRSKVQRLPIQPVSQASADQRAGRCGRIGPGICVRLYSQQDFENRPRFTVPEIRRTNLASVILQTLALDLGRIEEFPFLDPPRSDAIRDGYKTLFELGAVDSHRHLTPLGKQLARLPVDPRIGRMLFAADQENCLAETLIIAAGLELQDPRLRPAERKQAADQAHQRFANAKSDFLTLLNIWDFFHQQKENLSKSKLRLACDQNFLSFNLMIQWQDIHRQLSQMIVEAGLKPRKRENDYGAIHRSLLAGLLSGIAMAGDKHEFTGAGGLQFFIWPGSALFRSKTKWIVANEVIETSRRYGRTLAQIDPEWVEPLAKHLVKARYSDPHWSKKKQSVQATEHISLWGLPIVAGRMVNFGRLDPEAAREIFIQEGLANDGLDCEIEFIEFNRALIDEINDEMTKTRRRDLIVDHYRLESFYRKQLPEQIYDKVSLLQAARKTPGLNQQLTMARSDLLEESAESDGIQLFPDQVKVGSMSIPLNYKFAPGDADDGATIKLPLAGVAQLDDTQAAWLVPGLIETRILSLIRGLPKTLRRNLVPAPDTAAIVAKEIEFGKGNFYEAVAKKLTQIGGEPIRSEHFDLSKLEDHLKVNLQVVDDEGTVIAQGRSSTELRSQLGEKQVTFSSIVEVQDDRWKQNGLLDWTWPELPLEVTIRRGETELSAFPAIVDQGEGVGLRLADSRSAADLQTRGGLIRLFSILNRKSIKAQLQWLPNLDQQAVTLSRYLPVASIKGQLSDLIVRIGFVERDKIPRTEVEFRKLQANSVERISVATQDVSKWLPKLTTQLHQFQLALDEFPARFQSLKEDLKKQLSRLTEPDFLAKVPWSWLSHYPRYLEGMRVRMEKSSSTDPRKDQEFTRILAKYWDQYEQARTFQTQQAIVDPELTQFRWMIEEFRVSLFAQQLGTSLTISEPRLEKQWQKVIRV